MWSLRNRGFGLAFDDFFLEESSFDVQNGMKEFMLNQVSGGTTVKGKNEGEYIIKHPKTPTPSPDRFQSVKAELPALWAGESAAEKRRKGWQRSSRVCGITEFPARKKRN